jgi:uncharacterized protein with PQ loop repeat
MPAVLGVLASTLSIAVIWPQVWLSCRHRRTRGLSPTGTWLAVALNLCWLVFGLLVHDPAQVVTNAVVGAGNTAVLAALLLTQPRLRARRALLRTAPVAAGLAALAAGAGLAVLVLHAPAAAVATALGSVTALVGAAGALPQPLGLLRDRTQDVSGLSPARWRLGAASCAAWTGYGVMAGQPLPALAAAVGLACALVTCAVLARRTPAPVFPLPVRRPVRPAEQRPVLAAA